MKKVALSAESDPRFLARIDAARQSIRASRGVPLKEAPE